MDFSLANGGIIKQDGVTAATTTGTTITASATAHTKGAWTQVSAAAPESVRGFWLVVHSPSSYRYMLDVSYGAGNIVVATNLWLKMRPQTAGQQFWCPLHIPAGEAVYVRCQAGSGSATIACSIIWQCGEIVQPSWLGVATTYGATTASTSGTDFDPGGTANTKGAYTQITAATTRDIRSAMVCFGHQLNAASPPSYNQTRWLVDIAIGSAGSEAIRIPDLPVTIDSAGDCPLNPVFGPFHLYIPSGTRLAVRAQCTEIDSVLRLLGVVVVGFN